MASSIPASVPAEMAPALEARAGGGGARRTSRAACRRSSGTGPVSMESSVTDGITSVSASANGPWADDFVVERAAGASAGAA